MPWHPDKRQYRDFCSRKCTSKGTLSKREKTCEKKYGARYYSQTLDWYNKTIQTSRKKFGVDHYMQTDEYKQKIKENHPMHRQEVKDKVKSTRKL